MNEIGSGLGVSRTSHGSLEGVRAWDRWFLRRLLIPISHLPLSVVLWNGEEFAASSTPPRVRVRFLSRKVLYQLFLNPELNFGDFFTEGLIEVEGDLVEFLESYHRSHDAARGMSLGVLGKLFYSLNRSKENVTHHYDVGNEFYRLWLDRNAMQYTCAYFPNPTMTLEEAQEAKMHHVCRKLGLRPGQSVVEAGCGWGGLARFMATHYGVKVKAYNISRQQVAWARETANAQGLSDRVEYVEDDYRTIRGQYDAFVSVGMLEHVGIENFPVLGDVIHRSLKPDGMGLIHTIARNRPGLLNPWIRRRIFPGGHPPSLKQMMSVFEPHEFSVLDVENLRLHYAKTAEHWLARFEEHAGEITKQYGTPFVRSWRLYLAGTVAGFSSGTLQLFQVVFSRSHLNDLPWSRKHLYEEQPVRESHGAL